MQFLKDEMRVAKVSENVELSDIQQTGAFVPVKLNRMLKFTKNKNQSKNDDVNAFEKLRIQNSSKFKETENLLSLQDNKTITVDFPFKAIQNFCSSQVSSM